MKGVKAVNWRKDPAILDRLVKVEEAHLMGWSNYQIAASLKVTEGTIRNDLKRLQVIWHERVGDKIEVQKDRAVASYRRIQKAAWQSFGEVKDTSLNKSAYLNTAKGCEDSIGKVLGTLVEKREHSGPNGGPMELVVDSARERLASDIASIAARLGAGQPDSPPDGEGGR